MTEQALVEQARAMQAFSYAPYSNFPVGAALECEDGRVFLGCNVENAAYGSSICAERVALVKAISEGVRNFSRIAIVGSSSAPAWPCGECRQVLSEFSPSMQVLAADHHGNYEESTLDALLPHSFGPQTLGIKD